MINEINAHIQLALQEDIPNGDITSQCLNIENYPGSATLLAKQSGIFYGEAIVSQVCTLVDTSISFSLSIKDGQSFHKGQSLGYLHGPYASLLKAERILLNFLQRLSGIATQANRYVKQLNNANIQILDTRKTTPGYRYLEKEAVKAGGAHNHRQNLSDMVLIKENHLAAFAEQHGIENLETTLIQFKKTSPHIQIEIEIETLEQLKTYPLEHVDFIMFDNFKVEDVQKGLVILKERNISADIEISGGITLDNIHHYANLNIQRISIGALTHSVPAIDFSLLFNGIHRVTSTKTTVTPPS